MARRRHDELDEILELWARWVDQGGVLPTGGASMLARMVDNKGMLFFGGSGASVPVDCVELRVESLVMGLAKVNPIAADVLRLEVGAGWEPVVKRYGGRRGGHAESSQIGRAALLGLSDRTYRRRLMEARQHVIKGLGARDV